MIQNSSIANTLLCILSAVVTLTALEMGTRLYFLGELGLHAEQEPYMAPSETRGFKLIPNSTVRMQAPDFNVEARINRHGLRGPESDLTGNRERLLLVGDSGVFGSGVADDEIFPALLEKELGSDDVDVLNGGVSTYNNVQELFFLRETGLKMDPDSAILFLYPSNDLQANTKNLEQLYKNKPSRPHVTLDAAGTLAFDFSSLDIKYEKGDFDNKVNWLDFYKKSMIYGLANEVVRGFSKDEFRDPNVFLGWPFLKSFSPEYSTTRRDADDYEELWHESWSVTRKLILQMRDEVEAAGCRFAVSVLPHKIQIEKAYQDRILEFFPGLELDVFRINRKVQEFAEAEDITYIDTARPLQQAAERGATDIFFDITDEHMTAKAHELLVPALAKQIREKGLIGSD